MLAHYASAIEVESFFYNIYLYLVFTGFVGLLYAILLQ